jgi:hypothetical protein
VNLWDLSGFRVCIPSTVISDSIDISQRTKLGSYIFKKTVSTEYDLVTEVSTLKITNLIFEIRDFECLVNLKLDQNLMTEAWALLLGTGHRAQKAEAQKLNN